VITHLAITSWHDVGPRDAPAVVLLHAIATDSELWASQIPVWSQFARILAVDLPGHGASAPRPQIDSLDQYAHALAELLASVAIEDVAIVGLSFGGMIGQAFALNYPQRVRSLVLSNTSARTSAEMKEVWTRRKQDASTHGMQAQVATTIDRWFTPQFRETAPLHVERVANMIRRTSYEGYAAAIEAIRGLDLLDSLSSLEMPVLVVGGRKDAAVTPQVVEAMAQRIPKAQTLLLDDTAHLANVEQPVAFTEIVGRFLRAPWQSRFSA
jgi:3-oxoadipate enol-lactonase